MIRPAAILEALGRQKWRIARTGLALAILAGLLGLVFPRTYTSTTQLLIDPRGLRVLEKDIAPQAREPDQSVSVMESELRFLASDLVLNGVIERLELTKAAALEDKKKPSDSPGLMTWVSQTLGSLAQAGSDLGQGLRAIFGRAEQPQMTPAQMALDTLQKAVKVSRQTNTYVLDIEVKMKDRELAAKVANAIASEYIVARFTSRGEVSRRASESISGRLDELAAKVREADGAVERYKAANDLSSTSGRLLTESRLGELSTQLQVARAETVRAEARMAQVNALRASGGSLEGSIEALQSPTLERLRTTYASVRQREAALSSQLLPAHPLVRQVRQESRSVEQSVAQELSRIAQTARAGVDRAKSTEDALNRQLQELKSRAMGENQALVQLRELERVAETSRSIYQTFLTRSRELDEQQRIDPNSAVILAAAEPARKPNGPGLLPLIGVASIAGLGLGAAMALRRDTLDPKLHSALQIETLLGDDAAIHTLPLANRGWLGRGEPTMEYVGADEGTPTAEAALGLYRAVTGRLSSQGPRLCLVTAGEACQGKSTVALNLALAAARSGESVLLVDADRGERIATVAAGLGEQPGLAEVISGQTTAGAAIVKRQTPQVDLLPAGKLADLRTTPHSFDRISVTLKGAFNSYDLVVIDGGLAGRDRLTLALAEHSDISLLSVLSGTGQKSAVSEAKSWLGSTSKGPVQVVLVTA